MPSFPDTTEALDELRHLSKAAIPDIIGKAYDLDREISCHRIADAIRRNNSKLDGRAVARLTESLAEAARKVFNSSADFRSDISELVTLLESVEKSAGGSVDLRG